MAIGEKYPLHPSPCYCEPNQPDMVAGWNYSFRNTNQSISTRLAYFSLCTGAILYVRIPYSVLLISNKFSNGGSRAVKLLNRTGGVVWALKFLRSITRVSRRGWALDASKTLRKGPGDGFCNFLNQNQNLGTQGT